MNKQAIVGVNKYTGEITPISKVVKTGLGCECTCHSCETLLEAVLNTTRKKHFRHSNKSNCQPTPESELHLLAKYIILNNSSLFIPGMGMVEYADPVCEVKFHDLVPDATFTVDGQLYHVEIVVTNPINSYKFDKYKADLSRVLVINLGQEDRNLDYESLKNLVLNENDNRYMLSYSNPIIQHNDSVDNSLLMWLIGAVLAGYLIWRNFFKKEKQPKRRIRKRRG